MLEADGVLFAFEDEWAELGFVVKLSLIGKVCTTRNFI